MSTFAEVSAVTPDGPDHFTAEIHPNWTIGGKPNGGYLLALLGRAAALVGPHPHVIAASAHYLRAPEPGPATIETELLRSGRSASQVRTRLRQGDTHCIEALITLSELPTDGEPFWSANVPPMPDGDLEDAFRVPGTTPTGVHVAIMDEVDLRIGGANAWLTGRPSGRGELTGWLALPEHEPFDPLSLIYAVDAFPPATFEIRPTGWVPTLELTVYVRALPAPGPVRISQRAQLIDDGRVDEVCWVWDSTGRPVAHGTQLAGIRFD